MTDETITEGGTTAPALPEDPNSIAAIAKIPRGKRTITFPLKNSEATVTGRPKPLLIFIKQEVQRVIRRQQILRARIQGYEQHRAELLQAITDAAASTDSAKIAAAEKEYDSFLETVAKDEAAMQKSEFELTFACLAFEPIVTEDTQKATKFGDIDWEKTSTDDHARAQGFFLVK